MYLDHALYITNQQDNGEDLIDDIKDQQAQIVSLYHMYKLKDTCNDGGGMDISNAGVYIGSLTS